ncbi:uncharacterized protein SPAPADRAFT_63847 [Spathaspora passalidarum NRRL Y-27907]|uniref:Uncharacterized protein n=1 Tax=Spathaspora passalidarum (strain NRRL Y-27907 / 11-Y1) TaxID=619300 RepID=G3AVR1_SPAPN|nr:uncharacterized protein SPAPADRAFT_63847 [Spathaspora passalidarum NRRL Y-27907]EGW30226.1 hypothetical protein SPAPADRAFT_63847 [Spathaspora passalidarum NRRL Y-27907]
MSFSSSRDSMSTGADVERRASLSGGSMIRRRSSIESTRLQRRRTIEEAFTEVAAENVAHALPEGFNAKFADFRETTFLVKTKKYHTIIWNIIHGAIWGVLVRRGLTALTSYNGSYLSGVVWANFTACVVMGIAVDGEELWSILVDDHADIYPHKGAIPLYTGITTGFCGTVSSFSSVILEAFNKAADTEIGIHYNYPNGAYGIMQFLAVILAQFGLSIMGFHIGKQTSAVIDNYVRPITKRQYKIIEYISVTTGVCLVIITCVLIGVKHDGAWRSWTFSMFFAPFGAVLRFYLSKYLNSKVENFPMGTFTANVGGSLLLGIFTLIGRGKFGDNGRLNNSIIGCHVLNGLDDGFCGGLTTVSTFVVELFGLKTVFGYQYGVSSIMLSFIMVILVLGSYNWTVGLTDPYCS